MPFQKGHKFGKGRPKKIKTQVKDWIKDHPYAVSALMKVLYEKGIDGDREAAIYVIDRIKGKPKQQTDIDLKGDNLGKGLIIEFFKLLHEERLPKVIDIGGNDAIQGYTEETGLQ